MTLDSSPEPPVALGFLTVADQSPHGLVGGYLVLNAHARPLEFHATVPIRPNRAQEILYGPTLNPYLYGEQIGLTLVRTSKLRPLAVFTDCEPALAVAAHLDVPVWLVLPLPRETAPPGAAVAAVRCGSNYLAGRPALASAQPGDTTTAAELGEQLASVAAALDLSEPFERIRAAIEEAQRGVR